MSIIQEPGDTTTARGAFTVTETTEEFTAALTASLTWRIKLQTPEIVEPEVANE